MQRVVTPELLDRDAGTAAEIGASLADLRRINRLFGGIRTLQRLLRSVIKARGLTATSVTMLDVAAATGDVSEAVRRKLFAHGTLLRVTLLDIRRSHFPAARPDGPNAVVADALALPFADHSLDVVASSLFLHHLEPEQVTQFLREAMRVARHAVLVNDLRRHPMSLALIYAGMPLFRSPITRHDSVASVRRAYTIREMREMFRKAGADDFTLCRFYLFRMGAVLWKAPKR